MSETTVKERLEALEREALELYHMVADIKVSLTKMRKAHVSFYMGNYHQWIVIYAKINQIEGSALSRIGRIERLIVPSAIPGI